MKKLILACVTVAFIGLGGAPVHAQESDAPVDCVDQPSNNPNDPCYNPALYPPTTPQTSVLPPTTSTPTTTIKSLTPNLPDSGSSGMTPILGMGALLLLSGGLIVVAARRRNTSAIPAA